jgi:uncharacterized membrane protein YbhN (UPF0104 family)
MLATLLGIPALAKLARSTSYGWGLSVAVGVALLVLVATATVMGRSLSSGGVCGWLRDLLSKLPMVTVRRTLDRASASFSRTDSRLAAFCAAGPHTLARPTLLYLFAWLFEAAETYTILSLLGVALDWKVILLIEVCESMVRNMAFVLPSGLGAQDFSYAGLLQVFHVPNALSVAAVFVLLKRGKELLWALVGYVLLAGLSDRHGRNADNTHREELAIRVAPRTSLAEQ